MEFTTIGGQSAAINPLVVDSIVWRAEVATSCEGQPVSGVSRKLVQVLQHDAPDGQSRSMPTHPGTIWRT